MSVEQFIDQIAGKGLLDEALLQRLRRDATAEGNQWNPQDVIKFLVEQGHLTRFQGKNLLKELLLKGQKEKLQQREQREPQRHLVKRLTLQKKMKKVKRHHLTKSLPIKNLQKRNLLRKNK